MPKEELGVQLESPIGFKAAITTFIFFVVAGMVPLLPFLLESLSPHRNFLFASSCATMVSFFLIGLLKGRILERPLLKSGLETLSAGIAAASLGFLVGKWLENYS
jgi:VIT1/CCC1 family predicted Fe2+/Mn2+ transporter